jgi:hypothetical protein
LTRSVLAVGLALLLAGCAYQATRPPDSLLAPNEWVPTLGGPTAATSAAPAPSSTSKAPSTVEARLRAVQELQDQGLITSEEAKRKRAEILKEL